MIFKFHIMLKNTPIYLKSFLNSHLLETSPTFLFWYMENIVSQILRELLYINRLTLPSCVHLDLNIASNDL